ncbi:MAG: hypothetical protein WC768_00885 [Patescibacteria group bacterium]|jgi:hypothetical protein
MHNPSQIPNFTTLSFIKDIVAIIAPALFGYLGVTYGIKLYKAQKKHNVTEEQLNKFYSPLLGIRKEIRTKSEVRVKIERVGTKIWEKKCDAGQFPDIKSVDYEIDYNNKQLIEEFLPLYNQMLKIFRNNYWLAEPETREHYAKLVEFVEVWNRVEKKGITGEIAHKIGHSEENVKPFYDELEKREEILRNKLLE